VCACQTGKTRRARVDKLLDNVAKAGYATLLAMVNLSPLGVPNTAFDDSACCLLYFTTGLGPGGETGEWHMDLGR
jgi:hypothetical protein